MAVLETIQVEVTTPAVAATGTATFGAAGTDGDTLTIDDGIHAPVILELDDDEDVTAGNILVTIGADADATALATATAIQTAYAQGLLSVSVEVATNVVTVTHLLAGDYSSSLAETGDTITVANFDNGVDAVANITVSKPGVTANVELALNGDGSVQFADVLGNTVRAHSNPEMSKLFQALRVAAQA